MSKGKQSILEGGLILTLALVIIKLLGWLYRVELASLVGETGFGYYTTAYNLYNIVYSITVMGFPVAVSKIVSEYETQGRYRDIRTVIRVSKVLFAVVGVLGTLLLLALAGPYANSIVKEPLLFWSIIAVAPSIFFCCLMSVYRGYNQGLSNMTPTAISQVIEVFVKVAAGLAAAVIVKNALVNEYAAAGTVLGTAAQTIQEANVKIAALAAAGAMIGITLSTAVAYIYLALRHRKRGDRINREQLSASPDRHSGRYTLRRIIWVALPIALSAATASFAGLIDNSTIPNNIAHLLRTDLDTVLASHGGLLAKALESEGILGLPMYLYGLYGMELVVCNLVPTITGSFGLSALPLVSSSWTQQNYKETKRNIDASLRICMLIAAPAGCGIVALAQPISSLIYSNVPTGALIGAPMLQLLGIATILIALVGIVNSLLQGIGKPWAALWLMIAGLVVKAVTNYFLVAIPQYNIKAAPVGNIFCYFLIAVGGLIFLRSWTKIKINVMSTFVKPLLAGAACGVFALLGYNLIGMVISSNTVRTIGGIGLAALVYIIALGILKGIDREDTLSLPGGEKITRMLEKLRIIR